MSQLKYFIPAVNQGGPVQEILDVVPVAMT